MLLRRNVVLALLISRDAVFVCAYWLQLVYMWSCLQVTEKAKHYGYAANLDRDADPSKGLVLQYELKLAEGLTCGGAYLKFLNATDEFDAEGLVEDTPYVVMFGPDKCGSTNKVGISERTGCRAMFEKLAFGGGQIWAPSSNAALAGSPDCPTQGTERYCRGEAPQKPTDDPSGQRHPRVYCHLEAVRQQVSGGEFIKLVAGRDRREGLR